MAKTQFVVVHGIASGAIHYTVFPDDDAEIPGILARAPAGTTTLRLNHADYPTDKSNAAIIARNTTLALPVRAAVIDVSGTVVNVISADPALLPPVLAGMTITPHATASIGWKMAGGVLAAPARGIAP